MEFNKVKHGVVVAEFVGTFTLVLMLLASLWGFIPSTLPFAVLAALVLGLFVVGFGKISGAHLNPATTIGVYSLRKINSANLVAYLIAQIGGALLAMVVFSMFLNGELSSKLDVVADYRSFFGEFLGMLVLSFGIAASIHQKIDNFNAAFLIGGMYAVGMFLATLGGNGLINPAVAIGVSSLSWSYVLGPILGSVIGFNLYAAVFGKKGQM